MWKKSTGKRGGQVFDIFGEGATSGGGSGSGSFANQNRSSSTSLKITDYESLLRSQLKTLTSVSIGNWTCPYVSSGDKPGTGLIFSRGKGNKLHVLNAETLHTEIVKETSGHGLFSCRVHNDLVYVGCFDGHLFVFDLHTFEKKEYKRL